MAERAAVLGAGWATSPDLVWSLVPGSDGLRVVAGGVRDGAALTTRAELSVAGAETRAWIGHGCLLSDGHTVAAVFAPAESVNNEAEFGAAADAALVDLDTGLVRYLTTVRASLAYFSPTCGADGRATFTSYVVGMARTTMTVVGADASIARTVRAAGQLTGAVTTSSGTVVSAHGVDIVDAGSGRVLARASGPVANLTPQPDGSVMFTFDNASATTIGLLRNGTIRPLGTARLGSVGLDRRGSGTVVKATGFRGSLPEGARLATADRFATVSRLGDVTVIPTATPHDVAPAGETLTVSSLGGRSAPVPLPTGSADIPSNTPLAPEADAGGPPTVGVARAATTTVTTDANLPCAVQRNDPAIMAYQPSIAQVEWAVDQAVQGKLTTSHASNYRNFGLSAYSPQGLFPLPALVGGGAVPPQIMLGILANESNVRQASGHVSRGGYGNPLTGDIYGRGNTFTIDFSQADCGYGIAQVTDGMRVGQMTTAQQRAVAQDYQANIAAGLRILVQKWNQLRSYTPALTVNDGDPTWIENWYYALWAYNSGLQPDANNGNTTGCTPGPTCTDSLGYWGLGWFNNPANPIYPANRHIFNSVSTDPMNPDRWPYQERAIGWAAYPLYESAGQYTQAWWTSVDARNLAVAPVALLCVSGNHCSGATTLTQGVCSLSNYHCWTHFPVSWKTCVGGTCGFSNMRYAAGAAEPVDPATLDPAICSRAGLPSGAVIVDDASGTSRYSPCTGTTTKGSFKLTFAADANGNYPAHIDLHQINGGLNGHYWFTHVSAASGLMTVTGTWTFPSTVTGWGDVYVHVPALGATSLQARYTVKNAATGATRYRVVDTFYGANTWIKLGAMKLSAGSTVTQTSVAPHETGTKDIAFDAVAFAPRTRPASKVVSLGDSYSSGEGVEPFETRDPDNPSNDCHRSAMAYTRLMVIPGQNTPVGSNPSDELVTLACSGAIAESLTADAVNPPIPNVPSGVNYQNGQETQLDRGYVDADTDIVTVTIGGNDARFSDIAKICVGLLPPQLHDCNNPGTTLDGDPDSLVNFEPTVVNTLIPPKLAAVYARIHALAPNAKIYVAGYPPLFSGTHVDGCLGFTTGEQTWVAGLTATLNTRVQEQVAVRRAAGVNIFFANPVPQFTGHGLCDPKGGASYFNGIDILHVVYSMHPNADGTAAYARALNTAMALG